VRDVFGFARGHTARHTTLQSVNETRTPKTPDTLMHVMPISLSNKNQEARHKDDETYLVQTSSLCHQAASADGNKRATRTELPHSPIIAEGNDLSTGGAKNEMAYNGNASPYPYLWISLNEPLTLTSQSIWAVTLLHWYLQIRLKSSDHMKIPVADDKVKTARMYVPVANWWRR
jgi:hypothetical protein